MLPSNVSLSAGLDLFGALDLRAHLLASRPVALALRAGTLPDPPRIVLVTLPEGPATIDVSEPDTTLGPCLVGMAAGDLCFLWPFAPEEREAALRALGRAWPGAALRRLPDGPPPAAVAALVAGADPGRLRIVVRGTPFQVAVWQALLRVPPGSVVTYDDLAAAVGRPDAVRAVAGAVAANVVALGVPCHRVIRRDGGPGGFRWGLPLKRTLLAREARAAALV